MLNCRPKVFIRTVILLALCMTAAAQSPEQGHNVIFFSARDGFFSATGKWASTTSDPKDQPAYPQEVEIDCFRETRNCVEAEAEYYMGNPHITVFYHDIIRWDKNGIVASSGSSPCMTNTLMINFADQAISSTSSLKSIDEEMKKACASFGTGPSHSYVFVLKGTDRWEKEHWKVLTDK
jgi:hypothetical protein